MRLGIGCRCSSDGIFRRPAFKKLDAFAGKDGLLLRISLERRSPDPGARDAFEEGLRFSAVLSCELGSKDGCRRGTGHGLNTIKKSSDGGFPCTSGSQVTRGFSWMSSWESFPMIELAATTPGDRRIPPAVLYSD